jgi:hypothetical protein
MDDVIVMIESRLTGGEGGTGAFVTGSDDVVLRG